MDKSGWHDIALNKTRVLMRAIHAGGDRWWPSFSSWLCRLPQWKLQGCSWVRGGLPECASFRNPYVTASIMSKVRGREP